MPSYTAHQAFDKKGTRAFCYILANRANPPSAATNKISRRSPAWKSRSQFLSSCNEAAQHTLSVPLCYGANQDSVSVPQTRTQKLVLTRTKTHTPERLAESASDTSSERSTWISERMSDPSC
eukprot:323037-Pleurochrysis_carterae.AAC.5